MIFFDVVVWLAVAKVAVMLFEDASYAVRGKRSPRVKARTKRHTGNAAQAAGGAWARTRTALGAYTAGLIEDGITAARASRRRRAAHRRGRTAVDSVLINLDDNNLFYADCDRCGWCSRGYQLQDNARAAGAEHAHTHHTPEQEKDDHRNDDGRTEEPTEPSAAAPRRLRVIPGGADPRPTEATPAATQPPTPQHPGQDDDPAEMDPADDPSADTDPAGGSPAAGTDTGKEQFVNLEAAGPEEIRAAFSTAIDTATERAEDTAGIAGVLTEAADRFESLEMSPSTVGHLRDAAEQFTAAQAALTTAAEELEAALADFNARDGAVAETVADTGGNVASKEVLVG